MSPAKQYVSGTGNAKNLSSVAQTCNQLSLFLKDKGGCLKDLHFGINSKFDDSVKSVPPPTTKSTIDLLSNMENLGQNNYSTYDDNTPAVTTAANSESSSKTTKQTMTIFYKGQVMVVDDISEDRAKEVFILAAATNNSATLLSNKAAKVAAAVSSEPAANLGSNNNNNQRRIDHAQLQPNNGLDLPIARRASLHKFLAKRKDRANLRPEPYHLFPNNNHHPSSSGPTTKNEHNFDLNL